MQGWPTWRGQVCMLPTTKIPNVRLQNIPNFGHFHPSISLSLYSKGVQPSWYPCVTLTKTARGPGSWEGSSGSSFKAEHNGSAGIPAVCCWMELSQAHSWILGQLGPLGFSSLCWLSAAQSWGFRLSVTPKSKPFYCMSGIASARDLCLTAHKVCHSLHLLTFFLQSWRLKMGFLKMKAENCKSTCL